MQITTHITAASDKYKVQVDVRLSTLEQELSSQIGYELVEVGGEFNGSVTYPGDDSPTLIAFSLPPEQRRLGPDFPYTQVWDREDYEDAPGNAKVYEQVMISRLTAAKENLMSKNTPFTGMNTVTV